jgi:hypothetical protein
MPDRAALAQFFVGYTTVRCAHEHIAGSALAATLPATAQTAGWRPSITLELSNPLGCLSGARRMIVDAREKRVSLGIEFPLRSSNGALNGSLT